MKERLEGSALLISLSIQRGRAPVCVARVASTRVLASDELLVVPLVDATAGTGAATWAPARFMDLGYKGNRL